MLHCFYVFELCSRVQEKLRREYHQRRRIRRKNDPRRRSMVIIYTLILINHFDSLLLSVSAYNLPVFSHWVCVKLNYELIVSHSTQITDFIKTDYCSWK